MPACSSGSSREKADIVHNPHLPINLGASRRTCSCIAYLHAVANQEKPGDSGQLQAVIANPPFSPPVHCRSHLLLSRQEGGLVALACRWAACLTVDNQPQMVTLLFSPSPKGLGRGPTTFARKKKKKTANQALITNCVLVSLLCTQVSTTRRLGRKTTWHL
jgi:hypothetical protein